MPENGQSEEEPQPISLEEAKRLWNLQKQNKPLSARDRQLLEQVADWQMWTSHGIGLKPSNATSESSSKASHRGQKTKAAS
ncbi:MAG: hypothetical protein AAGA58_04455 [Verrucomicrobiota bacterium]